MDQAKGPFSTSEEEEHEYVLSCSSSRIGVGVVVGHVTREVVDVGEVVVVREEIVGVRDGSQ